MDPTKPDKPKSKNYLNLCKQLPDLEENIKQGYLNIVPIPKNLKYPLISNWNEREYSLTQSFTYENKKGKKFTQVGLQYHTGNFGVIIGYNNTKNGYSIGCIDIDGYTADTEDENEKAIIKAETQDLIYNDLKDLPNCLIVQTQSGGYHIYYWTKETEPSTSKTSHSLSFPKDFKIKELAGKPIKDSIEIFTNHDKKQTVLPASTIYDKVNRIKREYKVISTVNKFNDIDILDNLNETVLNHLINKGYGYDPNPVTVPKGNSNQKTRKPKKKLKTGNDSKLRKLKHNQIKQVTKLVTPIYKKLDGKKHEATLYLGGYFSYHISKKSAVKIANGIVNEIGNIFDNPEAFKHTLLQNYEEKERLKAGLPKLCNLILSYDKEFNISEFTDQLNGICNQSFTKELVTDIIINENQVPVYLYEDSKTKWLRYEGILNNTDLILNLNTFIGQFTDSKTDKELTSFNFKFENQFFNITNPVKNTVSGMLKTFGLDLPKYFTEIIRTSINNLDKYMLAPKELSREVTLKNLFISRNKESYARKELGNYLHENGTILRRGINKPYIRNSNNGYDSVEIDDILEYLYNTGDFQLNTIHTDDIKQALGFISERIKPSYNIVKFPNCLYDIKNFKVIENPDKPILTLTEVQYNYNPEAKGNLVVEFLETSLKQPDDTPEEVQERVQGFKEFIGYLLTSGNPKNAWFILSGIGGAGKGVATRLIISIFGYEKVGDLKLQDLTPDNRFATAHLESKVINIVRDSPKKPIEDTGMLKAITGYDDIGIEPKGKDKYILPKEEVPDMVTVCNNIPRFKEGFDESILQRAIIFEFLNKFRGTDKQNEELEAEILENTEEMEYLIYQSIQAYKDMVENKRDFNARVSEAKTMELLGKHTDPISYILPKLVKYNPKAEDDGEEPIKTIELNKLILFVGNKLGLNITSLNKEGIIKPITLLNKIRYEFGLSDEEYTTDRRNYQNPENNYKWETITVYPHLYKTPEYDEYLIQMEEDEIE